MAVGFSEIGCLRPVQNFKTFDILNKNLILLFVIRIYLLKKCYGFLNFI